VVGAGVVMEVVVVGAVDASPWSSAASLQSGKIKKKLQYFITYFCLVCEELMVTIFRRLLIKT
jgi:hypothetical protein